MKIIYDEEIVLKDKQAEVERAERARSKYILSMLTSFIVMGGLMVLVAVILYLKDYLKNAEDALMFGVLAVLGICIVTLFVMSLLSEAYDTEIHFKASYRYYLILEVCKNCTLLSQDVYDDVLEMRYKDSNSFITRQKVYLNDMPKKEKDNINEIIINFNTNEIWMPYKARKEETKYEDN